MADTRHVLAMQFVTRTFLVMLGVASASLMSSCLSPQESNYMKGVGGSYQPSMTNGKYHRAPAIQDDLSYWDGDGVSGEALVRINTGEQQAYFYKGGKLVAISKISTGDEMHGTPPGRYTISEKDDNHGSSTYGVFKDKVTNKVVNDEVDMTKDRVPAGAYFVKAPMPHFMRFNGGVGMHTGYLPGYPASHGCVRMPDHMAKHFFENVRVGTPVIVE